REKSVGSSRRAGARGRGSGSGATGSMRPIVGIGRPGHNRGAIYVRRRPAAACLVTAPQQLAAGLLVTIADPPRGKPEAAKLSPPPPPYLAVSTRLDRPIRRSSSRLRQKWGRQHLAHRFCASGLRLIRSSGGRIHLLWTSTSPRHGSGATRTL